LKKLGFIVGGVILTLFAAILIVPSFLDWNSYKQEIQKTASDLTGREVRIGGDISLSLLPSPAFSAKDVTISNLDVSGDAVQNPERAQHMVSLQSADVKIALLPLLGGKIKVSKFILIDPMIALEVLEDGRPNWVFGENTSSQEPQPSSGQVNFSLEKFQIENGQVSFQNFATGQKQLVRKIFADVTMKSLQGPFDVMGSAKYQNLPMDVTVSVGKMRTGRKVPVSVNAGFFDNSVNVKFVGGGLLDDPSALGGSGKLQVRASDLSDIARIMDALDENQKARSLPEFNQAFSLETSIDADQSNVSFKDMELVMGETRGEGSFGTTLGENMFFKGRLALNTLNLDPLLGIFDNQGSSQSSGSAEKTSSNMDLALLDRLEGTLNVKLGALRYNDKIASQLAIDLSSKDGVLSLEKMHANMPGAASFDLTGQLSAVENRPTFNGQMAFNSGNLRAFLDWLKIDVTDIPAGRLTRSSLRGNIQADDQLVQFYNVDGTLDTGRFTGGISYALQDRPAFGADIVLSNFNIDSYLAQKTEEKSETSSDDWVKSLAVLDDFDANYIVKLENMTVEGTKIREADLSGSLIGGKLVADKIKLRDFAGIDLTASGTGQNFADNPSIQMDIDLKAPNLARANRLLKLDSDLDLRRMGALTLKGKISSTLEKLDIDLDSTLGASRIIAKGNMRSPTLKKLPEVGSMAMDVSVANRSLAAIIDQFDLPMTAPRPQDDRTFKLNSKLTGNMSLLDLDGVIQIAGGTINVKGRSQQKNPTDKRYMDVTLDAKSKNLKTFVRGLGIDFKPSKNNLGPLQLKTKLTGTEDKVTLSNLAGNVGPVKLSANGTLDFAAAKPTFDLKMTAGEIPLSDFMQAAPAQKKAPKKSGEWAKTPIELKPFNAYQGKAVVSASKLTYEDYIFDQPKFNAELNNGVVTISDFTGKLFGGDVVMNGSFGGNSKAALDLDMKLTNASLADVTKASAGIAPISGYIDIEGKFTGQGISQDDLISSLAGDGTVKASPGMINGIDIPRISEELSNLSTNNNFGRLLGLALRGGQTSYKGGLSSITAKNGKISFSPLDVELDGAKSSIVMGINLFQWDMSLDGDVALLDHPSAPPIGLSVAGALNNPVVNFQTDRLKKYVGNKIASNVLQNLVGGNSGVQGIFGGQKTQQAPAPAPTPNPAPANDQQPVQQPPAQQPVVQEPAPAEQQRPTPEDFGKKLFEKLFQKQENPDPK